jgi:3D (Asp-Asp-Asp) domain-containing protein
MRRLLRRLVALAALATFVVFVFASTTRDSADEGVVDAQGRPRLGTALRFEATAYCKGTTTAAGTAVRGGMAAADPALLPLGSVLRVDVGDERYSGIWTVMDTGPEVKGRELDLYMWSCFEALAFGRKPVRVTILRLGWDPQQSAPGPVEQLFRRREQARPPDPPPVTAPAPPAAGSPRAPETLAAGDEPASADTPPRTTLAPPDGQVAIVTDGDVAPSRGGAAGTLVNVDARGRFAG